MLVVKEAKPVIIKNEDFKKCILLISYPLERITIEENKLFNDIVCSKSRKYDDYKKTFVAEINNYCLNFRFNIVDICETSFLEIMIDFPCEKVLGIDVLEDNLLYAKEIIYNSILFDEKNLNKVLNEKRKILKNDYSRILENVFEYYYYHNYLLINERDYLVNKAIENPNIFDKVTSDRLLSVYNNAINKNPMIFLIGNVDKDKSAKIINKIFYNNKDNIEFEGVYNHYFSNIPDKVIIKKEKNKYKSSFIACNYKLKYNDGIKDEKILIIIKKLLDSNNSDLLFENLRTKNNLVYQCGCEYIDTALTLTIWAFTGKKNINRAKEIIFNTFNKINDINFIDKQLKIIKEDAKIENLLDKENLLKILLNEVDKYIEASPKNFYDDIKDITAKDVYSFINNKLTLVSIYEGLGVDNE